MNTHHHLSICWVVTSGVKERADQKGKEKERSAVLDGGGAGLVGGGGEKRLLSGDNI